MSLAAAERLDHTFHALADPTRRALIGQLKLGRQRVTDLADSYSMSLNAISKHIKVLERAGLVERQVQGREHRIQLSINSFTEAEAWLAETREFWQTRLDRLDHVLEQRRLAAQKNKITEEPR
ncbi:MAG: metalloregulator ArsR/SmtB family transcription factor [Gemmatimonadota bacterium]